MPVSQWMSSKLLKELENAFNYLLINLVMVAMLFFPDLTRISKRNSQEFNSYLIT